ncbi:MAG: hypothetical protein OSB25_12750, partial [Salibacteraceae bacterium]|nr:hypothetical protein [Salibacteraceae bacterium]
MSLKHILTYLCATLLLLAFTVQVSGQIGGANYIYNKGASITIPKDVSLYIKDGQYRHDELNGGNALIGITGELSADSGLIFNITNNVNGHKLFKFPVGAKFGTVKFSGGEIGGNSIPVFGTVQLNSTNRLKLNTNIGVYRNFDLTMGSVNLNAKQVSLYENSARGLFTGEINYESETNYIFDNAGAGSVSIEIKDPFDKLSYPNGNANTTFGNVGAVVNTIDVNHDIVISRVYGVQNPDKSFNKYFLIEPAGTITDPKLTLNYFNRDKPASSTPANYRIFRAATDANTNYTPAITAVDAGLKKVETTKADITGVAQRYVIGECPTEPTVDLEKKYSICTNDKP